MEALTLQQSPHYSSMASIPWMEDVISIAASGRFFQVANDEKPRVTLTSGVYENECGLASVG